MIIVPETPRWLVLNGKDEQAEKVMNYISWFNGSSYRVPAGS